MNNIKGKLFRLVARSQWPEARNEPLKRKIIFFARKFRFRVFVLSFLITLIASINTYDVLAKDKANGGIAAPKSVSPLLNGPEQELFSLQPKHPDYRLNGCEVTAEGANNLLFEFSKPGRSVLVIKTRKVLTIKNQSGLTARLRPGWDGTLGYSLYALEVECEAAGSGQVNLDVCPIPSEGGQTFAEFDARSSRFPDTRAPFLKWQQEFRDKLIKRLMNGSFPAHVPPEAEVVSTEDHELFTLRKIRYKTQSDRFNTLLLSLPKKVSGPVPLLLALHGHEAKWGEADSGAFTYDHADDFCAYFAERGWAVLQPATMNHTLQHAGWTLQGEWTWDAMMALDYVTTFPRIDTQRISVVGLSTGAHLAMNMLALDSRVRSGVVGCILSSWNHYRQRILFPPGCDCGILGQLGDWLEQCDWAALAAPKPVQFQHGRKDAMFCPGADPALLQKEWSTVVMPQKEFDAVYNEVKRAYQLTEATEQLQLHIHNDVHKVDNEAAYLFLNSEVKK